ncbi:conserved hypothetical protein [Shewanella sediminis HAW-EB3]|uniref:Uncharacterized protein n=1 Tax=Shewanella sediminis (strain HAW-EB3) TaxID=425104 RepID=A8FQM4_SHESH|nr:hypothetical protein [Shewanella sediminis]ABV35147.1 conserved hypothetical protein [Shewanella sediminis HAW-EB3]
MARIIQIALFSFFLISVQFLGASYANAQMTHVSINQQLFGLGDYPKLRVNIVSGHENLDKVQFIVRQTSGDERLMVKPINNFMLLLTGVDDVVDPSAQLIVKEYRVNQWHLIKTLALFTDEQIAKGFSAKTQPKPKPKAKQKQVKQKVEVESGVAVSTKSTQNSKPASAALLAAQTSNTSTVAELTQDNCVLEYDGNQTLWRIGTQYSQEWEMGTYGAMLAIFEANPKAFNKGEISGLRADVALLCPSVPLKEKYRDNQMAKRIYEKL